MTTASAPQHADLLRFLDERAIRYEIIDGEVVVTPPDRLAHARTVPWVAAALIGAAPSGVTVLGPSYALYYGEGNHLLPDVVVARDEDCGPRGLTGPPLLVVEVLSPSTRRRDLGVKREVYAGAGAPLYWLVDPEARTVRVLRLAGGAYQEVHTALGHLEVDEPFPVVLDLPG